MFESCKRNITIDLSLVELDKSFLIKKMKWLLVKAVVGQGVEFLQPQRSYDVTSRERRAAERSRRKRRPTRRAQQVHTSTIRKLPSRKNKQRMARRTCERRA